MRKNKSLKQKQQQKIKDNLQLTDHNKFNILKSISNNKLLIGLVAIFVNIGSRYVELKLTNGQEMMLRGIAREVLIFCITLLMTRDIVIALILTASFLVMSRYIFNENSKFCMLPDKYKNLNTIIDTNNDNVVSDEEIKTAEKILQKAKDQQQLSNKIFMLNNLY